MQKRLNLYIAYITKVLNHELPVISAFDESSNYTIISAKDVAPTRKEYERLLKRHIEQISFFQNALILEGIMLGVFLILSVLALISVVSCTTFNIAPVIILAILSISTLLLAVRYVKLYIGVSQLYTQYDEISKKML